MNSPDKDGAVNPRRELNLDTAISGVALLAALGLLVITLQDKRAQVNIAAADAPADLPLILLGLWALLSAIIFIRSLMPGQYEDIAPLGLMRQAPIVLILTVTILAMLSFGYLIPVSVGLALVLWLLGERRPLAFGLTWLVLGPGLWALLHHILQIRLPSLLSGGLL
ncbi:tripartite tricarboxylate transporter TctB family protein [Paracoccus sp. 22332]|uniref:tripartite tricarboxylate transporter TctB family protein n=1 Tax=Paracoccus sp. 22332 TaxID=3453913 RepID=UPI003F84BCDD